MAYNDGNVLMEDMRIVFRNFAGKEGMFNAEGTRSFAVLLDDDIANRMDEDGWNIKWLKPREEGDSPQAYISVALKYGKGRPPKISMVTSRGQTQLSEDEVELLDWADIKSTDLIVRPYNWTMFEGTPQQKSGVKAYLKSMVVIIEEDALDLKYNEIPDAIETGSRLAIESAVAGPNTIAARDDDIILEDDDDDDNPPWDKD